MNGDTEGGCAFCGKRWSLLGALGRGVIHAPTDDEGGAVFVLCEHCWDTATADDRVAAHTWRLDSWLTSGALPRSRDERAWIAAMRDYVVAAIRADDVEVAVTHGGTHTTTRARRKETAR